MRDAPAACQHRDRYTNRQRNVQHVLATCRVNAMQCRLTLNRISSFYNIVVRPVASVNFILICNTVALLFSLLILFCFNVFSTCTVNEVDQLSATLYVFRLRNFKGFVMGCVNWQVLKHTVKSMNVA